MIRPSDWALIGLSARAARFGVPAAPAAAPLRAAEAPYCLLWHPGNRNPPLHAFVRMARVFGHRRAPQIGLSAE